MNPSERVSLPASTGSVTLGVAIEVPEPFGSLLRDKRASFGDELAATVPSHVTLAPPLERSVAEIAVVSDQLSRVAAAVAPFSISLRGTGTFRPVSPVVFIALTQGIEATTDLASAVHEAVGAPPTEFPFHPHVTVAHHLDDWMLDRAHADLAGFRADFRVGCFALFTQEPGTGWTPRQHFPLTGS